MKTVLNDQHWFEESKWEPAFSVSGLECLMMKFEPSTYRSAQKASMFPEYCDKSNKLSLASLELDESYCGDYFDYTIPWSAILKPRFTSTCY